MPSEKGGRAAVKEAVSAATIAKVLSGINFPKDRDGLKDYARTNAPKSGIDKPTGVIKVIEKLPDKNYKDMADVERSVSQVI